MQRVAAPSLSESWQEFLDALGQFLVAQSDLLLPGVLLLVWVAWWLWGVRWSKTWPVLAQGAWLPFVLLGSVIALVWSQVAPSTCSILNLLVVPNFWWQLGSVGLLFCLTLFCGWLQGVMNWAPAELELSPGLHGHHDNHGHGHDDEHVHASGPASAHGHGHS